MANFAICIDPQLSRRVRFEAAAAQHIAPVAGLSVSRQVHGDLTLICAASHRAPVTVSDGAEGLDFVAGLPRNRNVTLDATSIFTTVNPVESTVAFDGYFAATRWSHNRKFAAVTDVLGLFPLFYWSRDEALVVATSPELIRFHPSFEKHLCERALVSMLLLMHPVGGDTLWEGVRRLSPGCILRWQPGDSPEEVPHARSVESMFDVPLSECIRLVDAALEASIHADLPSDRRAGLLLSGGLDSRMVGGYLQAASANVEALTLGLEGDIELRCARATAAALGCRQSVTETVQQDYARFSSLQATWEHGLNGFNTVVEWDLPSQVQQLPDVVFTGYVMDSVVGGSHIEWAAERGGGALTFAAFWKRINALGFNRQALQRLLRPRLRPLVDQVIADIETEYLSLSDAPSRRAWLFDLRYRQRFHVARGAWLLSFGAWPVLPVLDRRVLATCERIPTPALAERVLQRQLLIRRFPVLAAVPLDRGFSRPEMLRPRLRYQLEEFIGDRISVLRRPRQGGSGTNPLRYYRVFDLNSSGWKDIRRAWEPFRNVLDDYLEPDVLGGILPAPDEDITLADGIIDACRLKTLLGLWGWSGTHQNALAPPNTVGDGAQAGV